MPAHDDKGYAFFVSRDLFMLVTGSAAPPQDFWNRYCDAIKAAALRGPIRILVDARAGQRRPNPWQRQQLEDAVPPGKVRAAVISDRTVVRMVTKVFSWVGYDTEGFTSTQIEQAAAYLDCTREEWAWVEQYMEEQQ